MSATSMGRAVGAIALACGTMLSGCGFLPGPSLTPNSMPAPADVASHYQEFDDAWRKLSQAMGGASDGQVAEAFVAFGYDVSKERCETFFQRVDVAQSQGNFAKTLSTSAGTGIGLATSLTGAAVKVLAGIFGATGIIPGIIDSYSKEFLLSELGDELAAKVTGAMGDFSKANLPSTATKTSALQMVRSHAAICTVPVMKAIVKAAVKNTEIEVNTSTSGGGQPTSPAPAAAAPGAPAPRAQAVVRGAVVTKPSPKPLMSVGDYKLVPK